MNYFVIIRKLSIKERHLASLGLMSEKKIVKIFVFRCNHTIKWCDPHLFLKGNYDYRRKGTKHGT